MALDIERMMERVLQMAEQKQKTLGINSYWGGTTSNASRAHDDAQTRAKWDAIDRKDALRDKISSDEKMTAEKTTADQYRSALKSQQDQYNTDAKNRNAIEVANIRAGGTSRKDPSTLSAHERTQAAIEVMRQNPGLPGKPGMDLTTAAKEVDKMHSQGQTKLNPDGTVAPAGVGISEQRQELVPGHKNAPLAERTGITVPAGQLTRPIDTPMGAAPSALSANQWQQYADSKSPGMKYVGNQPGMVGDQIARFKRPDGSAFFANTGAAQMQMGNALTPAVPSSPLVNAPGAEPRATMPDASNRSAMNTAKAVPRGTELTASGQPRPTPPLVEAFTNFKQGLTGPGGQFGDITQPISPPSTVELAMRNMLEASQGVPSSGFTPPVQASDKPSTLGPDEAKLRLANVAKRDARRLGPTTTRTSVEAKTEQDNSLPKGIVGWFKDLNKRKTSTNPLFPNYAQE